MEEGASDDVLTTDMTDAQDLFLALLVYPSGLLSLFGSFMIVLDIWKHTKERRGYHRVVLGMCAADCFITTTVLLQSFLTPPDQNERITSFGNHATCQFLGFGLVLGTASYFYSGMLAFYYLTTIVYRWTETKFSKLEPYLHGIAFGFPLICATTGVIFQWYGQTSLRSLCFLDRWPEGCDEDPESTCWSDLIAWVTGGIPILSLLLFVIYSNLRVYFHVRWVLQKSRRHDFATAVGAEDENSRANKQLRQVRTQSILYVLACWGTAWPGYVVGILDNNYPVDQESRLFVLYMIHCILFPSFGIWAAMIYFRPKYLTLLEKFPNQPRTWRLRRTFFPLSDGKDNTTRVKTTQANAPSNTETRPGVTGVAVSSLSQERFEDDK